MKGGKKNLQSYIDRFTWVVVDVEGTEVAIQCWIFENGLFRDHHFRTKLGEWKVLMTQDILNLAQAYITLEEKLITCFDNPTSTINTTSNHPSRKESHRRKEETEKGDVQSVNTFEYFLG